MTRLLVHVEGETEETFVKETLLPHLTPLGYERVAAYLIGNARQRSHRGGIKPWDVVKRDIIRHLKEDSGCIVTTMVDYYAMPSNEESGWPQRAAAASMTTNNKSSEIEKGMSLDVCAEMGDGFNPNRFIPYVVMHEFEGLLFSDCTAFAEGIFVPNLASSFQEIRNQFETPEDINDNPLTAPSKRVEGLLPTYKKVLQGNLAALAVGIPCIRQECPKFGLWIDRLEAAAS